MGPWSKISLSLANISETPSKRTVSVMRNGGTKNEKDHQPAKKG